jgi:hypothetical protein
MLFCCPCLHIWDVCKFPVMRYHMLLRDCRQAASCGQRNQRRRCGKRRPRVACLALRPSKSHHADYSPPGVRDIGMRPLDGGRLLHVAQGLSRYGRPTSHVPPHVYPVAGAGALVHKPHSCKEHNLPMSQFWQKLCRFRKLANVTKPFSDIIFALDLTGSSRSGSIQYLLPSRLGSAYLAVVPIVPPGDLNWFQC